MKKSVFSSVAAFVLVGLVLSCLRLSPYVSAASALKTKINPKDGAEMVWVAQGPFSMGDDAGAKSEKPARKVDLSGFWIYKNEVTVGQYKKFAQETGRKLLTEPSWGWNDNFPITYVSWDDAADYCKWAGAALPTEAQWEKAARGPDGLKWPWGNTYDAKRAWARAGTIKPQAVGLLPAGASPYGALDMAGNVSEWCADWYQEDYYASAPTKDPAGPAKGGTRVVRGGAYNYGNPDKVRGAARAQSTTGSMDRGLRCASNTP